jgi:hypothetical protein
LILTSGLFHLGRRSALQMLQEGKFWRLFFRLERPYQLEDPRIGSVRGTGEMLQSLAAEFANREMRSDFFYAGVGEFTVQITIQFRVRETTAHECLYRN